MCQKGGGAKKREKFQTSFDSKFENTVTNIYENQSDFSIKQENQTIVDLNQKHKKTGHSIKQRQTMHWITTYKNKKDNSVKQTEKQNNKREEYQDNKLIYKKEYEQKAHNKNEGFNRQTLTSIGEKQKEKHTEINHQKFGF